MKPTLLVLAAGMGSRYGGLKQVDPVGPSGETIMDYAIFDALRAGFGRVVFVIRHDFEKVFRETVGNKYKDLLDVAYAFQEMSDLPIGYHVPEERTKPWGTAHAIYSARQTVETPFAAINADDFYGRDAFARLGAFLGSPTPPPPPFHFAMVGYRLDLTLSENGTVARGICQLDAGSHLLGITEMTRIARVASGAIENREDPDCPVVLSGSDRVSMNLWGFTPGIFAVLTERFPLWLEKHGLEEKAEWYIPFVVDELIKDRKAVVNVLPTESTWFGVTYREDKPSVVASIARLVEAGEYPKKLF